jgi:hypothetical protein
MSRLAQLTYSFVRRVLALMLKRGLHVQDENKVHHQMVLGYRTTGINCVPTELMIALVALGKDPSIASAQHRFGADDLDDHSRYFLAAARRITKRRYKVTNEDAGHYHALYNGISEVAFTSGALLVHIWNAGHPRIEMNTWGHHFEDVILVIFATSLCDYDEPVPGDSSRVSASIQPIL